MDKPRWNDLLSRVTAEVEKLSKDVTRLAKEAADSQTGQEIRKAAKDIAPTMKKAVDDLRPEAKKLYDSVAPEVKRVVGDVVPGLRGAWAGVFGKGAQHPERPMRSDAPPNVSPDAYASPDERESDAREVAEEERSTGSAESENDDADSDEQSTTAAPASAPKSKPRRPRAGAKKGSARRAPPKKGGPGKGKS